MTRINRDEWLKALGEAERVDDPEAVTVMEFATMLGFAREAASRRLQALVKAGKAEKVTKRCAISDGRLMSLSAYRLLK